MKEESKICKVIIFDFDGVLADSFYNCYELNKKALASVGLRLTQKDYRDLFNENVHLGFKKFIKDGELYKKFVEIRKQEFDSYYSPSKVKLFPGTAKFLNKIGLTHNFNAVMRGANLAIASSTPANFIYSLLKKNRLQNVFGLILGNNEHTKENVIKTILARFKAKPKTAIMITDSVGDIKIAKKTGLKTIGVTWGFHSKNTIKKVKPDFVATSFSDLLKYLLT